jgi:hypothetical protein
LKLLFNFALGIWLMVYVGDVDLFRDNIDTISKNIETLLDANMEVGLEVNAEKTKYR